MSLFEQYYQTHLPEARLLSWREKKLDVSLHLVVPLCNVVHLGYKDIKLHWTTAYERKHFLSEYGEWRDREGERCWIHIHNLSTNFPCECLRWTPELYRSCPAVFMASSKWVFHNEKGKSDPSTTLTLFNSFFIVIVSIVFITKMQDCCKRKRIGKESEWLSRRIRHRKW